MRKLIIVLAAIVLTGCQSADDHGDKAAHDDEQHDNAPAASAGTHNLAEVLAAQSDEAKERYQYRHPQETLEFFEVEPGMTVVEALPGGGWYTKILLPWLGAEGQLTGADYAMEMWPLFGFFDDDAIEAKKTWTDDFVAQAQEWRGENGAGVSAFVLGSMPDEMAGSADRVLFIRALHNLSRFEEQGGFLTAAIADAYAALKPGGIAGVVQHQAPDDKPDEWADGSRGYLKKANVITAMENAGFEFVGEIGVNHNQKDQPGDDDIVWRLSPTFFTSREDPELKAEIAKIGESNRMTLKFRKPE